MLLRHLFLCALLLSLFNCANNNVAGGSEDINTYTISAVAITSAGTPLDSAAVTLTSPDGTTYTTQTDSSGQYTLETPEGSYAVFIVSRDSAYQYLNFSLDVSEDIKDAVDTVLNVGFITLSLPREFISTGSVSVRRTGISYPLSSLTLQNDAVVSVTIPLPQNIYTEIVYEDEYGSVNILHEESTAIAGTDTTDHSLRAIWDTLSVPASLGTASILSMDVSDSGSLWIGTVKAGTFIRGSDGIWYNDLSVEDKSNEQMMALDTIRAIDTHGDYALFISGGDVVIYFDNKYYNLTNYSSAVDSSTPQDILFPEVGLIYTAFTEKIGSYDTSWSLTETTVSSEQLGNVVAIAQGSNNEIYAIDEQGLLKRENDTWDYELKEPLAPRVMETGIDGVVIGTETGVVTYSEGVIKRDSITEGTAISSVVSDDESIWAAAEESARLFIINRSYSFIYDETNSPLKGDDRIAGVAVHDNITTVATTDGKLYTLRFELPSN